MSSGDRHFYEFADFRLDVEKRILWRNGQIVPLTPKAVEVLIALVEKHGDLLERDDLLERVWKDTFVEEANLTFTISNLRKVLGENGKNFIQTVPRRGYRFSLDVTEKIEDEADRPSPVVAEESIQNSAALVSEHASSIVPSEAPAADNRARKWMFAGAAAVAVVLALTALYYFWTTNYPGNSTAAATPKSIAVLPFKILSQDADESAFGLGITDSIVSRLGSLPFLIVRPATTVKKLADQQTDPIEIGRMMKTDAVLDGNYQRSDGRVRINVRLLKVEDGAQIWSGSFEEPEAELFKLQDIMSSQIARSLTTKLSPSDTQLLQTPLTKNKDAYESYIRGRFFWSKRTGDSLYKAIDYLKESTELDPNFAEAYAFLGDTQYMLFDYNYEMDAQVVARAKENIDTALKLKPELPDALVTQGTIQMTYEWNWAAAEASFKKALEASPNFATARSRYGALLVRMRRFQEAEEQFAKSIELDPVSTTAITNLGLVYFCRKDYPSADSQFKRALEIEEKFNTAHWLLSRSLWLQGRYDEAVSEIVRGLDGQGNSLLARRIEQKALQTGNEAAIRLLLFEWRENPPGTNPHNLAYLSTYVNDREKAIYWLGKSLEEHHPWTLWIKAAPEFESLQDDPRVQEIVRKTNL
jgi:DNA-binding winged helix-turn-helix (wHTH) protein/TolB-like protein/Tfp pilus assembly protein PilF